MFHVLSYLINIVIDRFYTLLFCTGAGVWCGMFHALSYLINIVIGRFYTSLFCTLEQTPCAHAACDSERVTVSFIYNAFFNIHRSGH